MSSIQHKRREALLFREVSEIITEKVNNSDISYPTVTGVKLSGDNSILKIFITFQSNEEQSLAALNRAKGYVRSEVAKISSLRKVPNIIFEIDKSIETGDRIEEILRKIKDSR